MNETLKVLYDRFYTPLPLAEYEQEVETCHHQLIERLEKPERKLVLRIIDTQNHIIEERSLDSFLCGFRLAWELAGELNHYEENRHLSSAEEAETGVENKGTERVNGRRKTDPFRKNCGHNTGSLSLSGQASCVLTTH